MRTELKNPPVFESPFAIYTAKMLVGQGGSGRVYQVEDDSGRSWALKVLDPNRTSRDKLRRFKNEYLFGMRNTHPNIISVSDHGVWNDRGKSSPFYVMPLYDRSLRDLIEGRISTAETLRLFSQILDGVEAAHLQGVVHRDLKPENILYDAAAKRLLVSDFGVARFTQEDLYTAVQTRQNDRLANFLYAAPEQRVRGQGVDQRADLYALGLMLNEMFTGKVAHGTNFTEIAAVAPEYSYLDPIVGQLLRQNPAERHQAIDDLKRELIGRQNEFVSRQRVSALRNEVVPVDAVDDPLMAEPPRIIGADWDNGVLTLEFNHVLNRGWTEALRNMGSYSFVQGAGPDDFRFQDRFARTRAAPEDVQQIIDHFKNWLPRANHEYAVRVQLERERAEQAERRRIQDELAKEETRLRVLRNLRL